MARKVSRSAAAEPEDEVARLRHDLEAARRREAQAVDREREALDQQAAMSEVLHAIVASPGDADAVLKAIAEHATRIGRAGDCRIFRVDGEMVRAVAHHGAHFRGLSVQLAWPLHERRVANEAIREARPVHVADIAAEAAGRFPEAVAAAERMGAPLNHVTWLVVPLLVGSEAIGGLHLRRDSVAPFTEREIAVVQAFAAEAALVIRTSRLFQEVTEALEQQTATSEILRVIASSPTDLSRVFEAVAERAYRLCRASSARVYLVEGDRLRVVASVADSDEALQAMGAFGSVGYSVSISRRSMGGLAVLEGRVLQIEDTDTDEVRRDFPESASGPAYPRTRLHVPLRRDGVGIGLLAVGRQQFSPFHESDIALLETFADQAVIAIENARLFEELERRNRELDARRWSSRPPPPRSCGSSRPRRRTCSRSSTRSSRAPRALSAPTARSSSTVEATACGRGARYGRSATDARGLDRAARRDPITSGHDGRPGVPGTSDDPRRGRARPPSSEFPDVGVRISDGAGARSHSRPAAARRRADRRPRGARDCEVRPFTERSRSRCWRRSRTRRSSPSRTPGCSRSWRRRNRELTRGAGAADRHRRGAAGDRLVARPISSAVLDAIAESAARLCDATDALDPPQRDGGLRAHGRRPRRGRRRTTAIGTARLPIDRDSSPAVPCSSAGPIHIADVGARVRTEYPVGQRVRSAWAIGRMLGDAAAARGRRRSARHR